MDMNLAGLERSQEKFHQAFDIHMEDAEEDLNVLKNDVDVMKIQMSSVEKDIKDVEMSIDNTHLRLEKVEDWVVSEPLSRRHSPMLALRAFLARKN
jgi:seryl-tRNA synthetase